ncbi:MAG: hypothetical protein ACI4O9_01995 [Akkermansia sp.]
MKKIAISMLVAAFAVTGFMSISTAAAASSHEKEMNCDNYNCFHCKGTGRTGMGQMRCPFCGGSGFQGSY